MGLVVGQRGQVIKRRRSGGCIAWAGGCTAWAGSLPSLSLSYLSSLCLCLSLSLSLSLSPFESSLCGSHGSVELMVLMWKMWQIEVVSWWWIDG